MLVLATHGVVVRRHGGPEIKPVEPDPGNSGGGRRVVATVLRPTVVSIYLPSRCQGCVDGGEMCASLNQPGSISRSPGANARRLMAVLVVAAAVADDDSGGSTAASGDSADRQAAAGLDAQHQPHRHLPRAGQGLVQGRRPRRRDPALRRHQPRHGGRQRQCRRRHQLPGQRDLLARRRPRPRQRRRRCCRATRRSWRCWPPATSRARRTSTARPTPASACRTRSRRSVP